MSHRRRLIFHSCLLQNLLRILIVNQFDLHESQCPIPGPGPGGFLSLHLTICIKESKQ
jgi:hypothetical protein